MSPSLLQSRLKHFRGADEVSLEIVSDGIRLETSWSSMGPSEGRNLIDRASLRTAVHVHQDELLECIRRGKSLLEMGIPRDEEDEGDEEDGGGGGGRAGAGTGVKEDPLDQPVKVCFGTHEVQAVLTFAIATKIPSVSLFFSDSGAPLLLSTVGPENDHPLDAGDASATATIPHVLTAELVVATVQDQAYATDASEPTREADHARKMDRDG